MNKNISFGSKNILTWLKLEGQVEVTLLWLQLWVLLPGFKLNHTQSNITV